MVLRSKPRRLRLASLALPFVVTAGCSSAPVAKPEAPRPYRDSAGVCWVMPDIQCPPPEVATCNPPPAQKVSCPEDPAQLSYDLYDDPPPLVPTRRDEEPCDPIADPDCQPLMPMPRNPPPPELIPEPQVDPQPLAPPKPPKIVPSRIRRDATGSCWAESADNCDSGDVICEPPESVPCPTDRATLTRDDYQPDVIRRVDGTCYRPVRASCPKPSDGSPPPTCNPPPPREVPCP